MLVLSAVLLLVVALVLTPAFTRLPEPVLAAVVIMAVRPFLAIRPLRAYLARDRRAFAVATSAVLGVAEFTLVSGLLIAVGLSLLIFVADASRLRISILGRQPDSGAYLPVDMFPDAIAPAGASVLRPDGQLFFANVGRLTAVVDAELSRPGPISRVLVIDLGASFELRLDVIDALARIRRRVIDHDRAFVFAHLRPDALAAAAKSDLAGVTTFANLDAAVAEAAALAASVSRSGRISDRIVNRAGTAGEP
jgi:MFS superfamily sulfate permease-like transporter